MVEVDERNWPVLEVRFEGETTDEQLGAYFDEHLAVFGRETRHSTLVDLRNVTIYPATPRHIRVLAEWLERHQEKFRRHCAGVGFLVDSPTQRALVRLLLRIAAIPVPYAVYDSERLAHAWVRARLQDKKTTTSQVTPESVELAEVPR